MYAREAALRLTLKRSFSTSFAPASHIGKSPIPVPSNVTFDLPPLSISPDLSIKSGGKRVVTVKGPLGERSVVVLPPIILSPPSGESSNFVVSVHDAAIKSHKSAWGLGRTLISNAITGVSTGYTKELRLVGVGYRAAIEPIPETYRALQAKMTKPARIPRPGAPPRPELEMPKERLNIKLGFSHPVLIDIPTDITVTTPQPTKIVLKGIDKERLGVFAARIRDWRKPEPYRGKGIFIDDETIKLKEVRKK